jgi:hypothetical protein
MADEVQFNPSLRINKSSANINYAPQTTVFKTDMSGDRGHTPGEMLVGIQGTQIDLSHLTSYGYIRMINRDTQNTVQWGIRDPDNNRFYPVGKLLPGEPVVFHMADGILGEQGLTGTGTTGPDNQLWAKSEYAPCLLLVEAFDD